MDVVFCLLLASLVCCSFGTCRGVSEKSVRLGYRWGGVFCFDFQVNCFSFFKQFFLIMKLKKKRKKKELGLVNGSS